MGSPATARRAPRQERAEERRERIIRAVLTVIGRGGIAAVTHRAVAEEAGVPLGSMAYYFATKDDLLRAALLVFVEQEAARLRALGASLAAAEARPGEIVDRFADAILTEAHDDPVATVAQFELYLESARNPALQAAAERCFAAYEQVTEVALRAAGAEDPTRGAALVVALSDGLAVRRLATPSAEQPELREELRDLLRALVPSAQDR